MSIRERSAYALKRLGKALYNKAELLGLGAGWGIGELSLTQKMTESLNQKTARSLEWAASNLKFTHVESMAKGTCPPYLEVLGARFYNLGGEIANLVGKPISYITSILCYDVVPDKGYYVFFTEKQMTTAVPHFISDVYTFDAYKYQPLKALGLPEKVMNVLRSMGLNPDSKCTVFKSFDSIGKYTLQPLDHWSECLKWAAILLGGMVALKYGPRLVKRLYKKSGKA